MLNIFFLIGILVVTLSIIIVLSSVLISTFWNSVIMQRPPFVPSAIKVYEAVRIYLEPQGVTSLLEIGSGDARGLRYLAKTTSWKLIGYDISRPLYYIAKLRSLPYTSQIKLYRKNIFNTQLPPVDAVYVYMYQDFNDTLVHTLLTELPQGTFIISYAFTFPSLTLVEIIELKNTLHKDLHVYRL